MPFDEKVSPQSLYHDVLRTLPGWRVTRADQDLCAPEILCRICANIQKSRAVVADLSGSNPNVFLELGMSWGVSTPYILLTQSVEKLPFDTKPFDAIPYERDQRDPTKVADADGLKAEVLKVLTGLAEPSQGPLATTREGALYLEVQKAKAAASGFWRLIDGQWRIVNVKDVGNRIGVSLLHSHPDTRKVSLVAQEAGVSPQAVYMYLTGKRGNHSAYFRLADGLQLTDDGVYWTIEELVPRILKEKTE